MSDTAPNPVTKTNPLSERLIAHLAALLRYLSDSEDECFCLDNADGSVCVKHMTQTTNDLVLSELGINVFDDAFNSPPQPAPLHCEYVSVWDGGTEIRTPCLYYPNTFVAVPEATDEGIEDLDHLDSEYIEFPSGEIIYRRDSDAPNGENFSVE